MNIREEPRDAAARELLEETGVSASAVDLMPVGEYRQPWAWHYDHVFLLHADPDVVQLRSTSTEIKDLQWFDRADLPPLTRAADYAFGRVGSLNV